MNADVIVLTDGLLLQLMSQPQFTSEFPFMSLPSQSQLGKIAVKTSDDKPCKPCQRKSLQRTAYINTVKAALASMSPAKKARFCQLAKANNVRLVYNNNQSQKIKATLSLS